MTTIYVLMIKVIGSTYDNIGNGFRENFRSSNFQEVENKRYTIVTAYKMSGIHCISKIDVIEE